MKIIRNTLPISDIYNLMKTGELTINRSYQRLSSSLTFKRTQSTRQKIIYKNVILRHDTNTLRVGNDSGLCRLKAITIIIILYAV